MILTFVNQKGGVGKSSLCVTLATLLARAPYSLRVRILDADTQHNAEGYTKALEGIGVAVESVDAHEMLALAEEHRESPQFDVILIDTPPTLTTALAAGLRVADVAMVPITNRDSYEGAEKMASTVATAQKNNEGLRVLYSLTMQVPHLKHYQEVVADARGKWGAEVLQSEIRRGTAWENASGKKIPLVLCSPRSKAAREAVAWGDEVTQVLGLEAKDATR